MQNLILCIDTNSDSRMNRVRVGEVKVQSQGKDAVFRYIESENNLTLWNGEFSL